MEEKGYFCGIIDEEMAKDTRERNNSSAFAELAPEVMGTVPPQAVELEETVLGALMLESDKITEVQEYLTEESFYKEEHRLIYRVCKMLSEVSHRQFVFTFIKSSCQFILNANVHRI